MSLSHRWPTAIAVTIVTVLGLPGMAFAADPPRPAGPSIATVRAEDPVVEEMVVDYVVGECGVSRARARQIVRVQDRSHNLTAKLRGRPGVVTFYHRSCRPGVVVQVLRGTPRGPMRKLARRYRVERWVSFQRVRFTLRETYRAQRAIERQLKPLRGRCILSTGQDTQGNGVSIELSTDATKADVALVRRAMKASPVPVSLTRIPGSLCISFDDDEEADGPEPAEEPGPRH